MSNDNVILLASTDAIDRIRQQKADKFASQLGVSKVIDPVGDLIFCGYSVYELVDAVFDKLEKRS